MALVYNDNRRGLGVGLQAFYQQVAMSYVNIKKTETDAFLRGQGDYQLAKIPHKRVISPIVAKAPNERWGMDLIDMSFGPNANRTHRYILTVIDYFSGYVWARVLTNKTDVSIRARLNNIINTAFPLGSSGTYPRILQTDNGTEFSNATLAAYTTQHQIRHIFTTSYSPESNGKVERANREIRKKIKAGNIRRNNHTWVAHLPAYIDNINSQMNSKSKMTAKQLWSPGYAAGPAIPPPLPALRNQITPAEERAIQRHYLENRSAGWQHGAMPTFQVGDLVRVNLASLSSEYRKSIKERRISSNAVHWSPVISRVMNVYPPNMNRVHPRYSITVGPAGFAPAGGVPPAPAANQVLMRGAVPWLFAGNQMTLCSRITTQI
jgi:transposase InsO family protein